MLQQSAAGDGLAPPDRRLARIMSNVGRMDGAFFVSRSELMSWANSQFSLNLTKIEQCANGAVYCQVIDACHPGLVSMKKVNWSARADHESIPNYKILQQAFDRCRISRHVDVDRLVRGKYQDNLEMLQWIKTYFHRTFQGGEYDAVGRRCTDCTLEWVTRGTRRGTVDPMSRPSSRVDTAQVPMHELLQPRGLAEASGCSGGSSCYSRGPVVGNGFVPEEEHERLREEVVDLKITVDGLETERDFYFQKLRDIEILCQALEARPDPHMTVSKFVEDVQRILYAKDEEDVDLDT